MDVLPVDAAKLPFLCLRKYPANHTISLLSTVDFLDSMIGRPFLEWNSRVGIPQTVWFMITTARVICDTCHLVRSFDGDGAHRVDGLCVDVGEGDGVVAEGKGKQRAGAPLQQPEVEVDEQNRPQETGSVDGDAIGLQVDGDAGDVGHM